MTTYAFVKAVGKDMATLRSIHGEQPWVLSQMKKTSYQRKCEITGEEIAPGERAWKPVTNALNRSDRISVEGMKQLRKGAS